MTENKLNTSTLNNMVIPNEKFITEIENYNPKVK